MVRSLTSWQSLNGVWQWEPHQNTEDPIPFGKPLKKNILVPFPPESDLSGLAINGTSHMFYRTFFEVSYPFF